MYQRILVPVDGSSLSVSTAHEAVDFAARVGASVIFLYVATKLSSTSDGALLHSMDPTAYSKLAEEKPVRILAEVSGYAGSRGIKHHSLSVEDSRPYEAIIRTGLRQGCDLIFMSSHGRRGIQGFLKTSQTEKVIQNSPIAVLVASVASNLDQALAA